MPFPMTQPPHPPDRIDGSGIRPQKRLLFIELEVTASPRNRLPIRCVHVSDNPFESNRPSNPPLGGYRKNRGTKAIFRLPTAKKSACLTSVARLTRFVDLDWYQKPPSRPLPRDRQRTNLAGSLLSASRNSRQQKRYQRCHLLHHCLDNSLH